MAGKDPESTENQIKLQEEYLKSFEDLEEGQLIDGSVIEINEENVFVDVGYKSEGKIPLEEFDEEPTIGDTVSVVLVKKEGRGGQVVVSKRKADSKVLWRNLRIAYQDNQPVEGTFIRNIKGGYEVDLGHGIRAFNPFSKTDIYRVENEDEWIGVKSNFLIDRMYNDSRVRLVVSRRAWLEREIADRREDFFENTQVGDIVTGVVKSFTSFGAFIDLGGFDGLLHINDMSWGHVTRPKDYVKKGQEIELKIIRLDPEEQKINLSLKHFTPDPWSTFEDKYMVGDVIKGRVTKLADFGAFIELEEGIEGLAHISELSWVKRINHPKELLGIGDEVDTKILAYDIQQGRVSLGLKQVYPNPWESIADKYPVGTRLERPAVKVTNAGAFIELEEGIDGFLHVDDMSWTKKIKNPSSVVNEGDEIETMILDVDTENRRIRLGMKQLADDPWKTLREAHPKGSIIEGEVTGVTDFGVFVRVMDDIEGLINKYHLVEPDSGVSEEEALEKYKVGESIKAIITDINPKTQRLSLSIREYSRKLQRQELSKYIHDEDNESTVTLGDILKTKNDDTE
jgi:small subunit ribosomal protein S1